MFNLWKLFFTSFSLPATYEKCKKIVTEKAVNHQDSDRIQVPSSIEWANTHFGGLADKAAISKTSVMQNSSKLNGQKLQDKTLLALP